MNRNYIITFGLFLTFFGAIKSMDYTSKKMQKSRIKDQSIILTMEVNNKIIDAKKELKVTVQKLDHVKKLLSKSKTLDLWFSLWGENEPYPYLPASIEYSPETSLMDLPEICKNHAEFLMRFQHKLLIAQENQKKKIATLLSVF